MAPRKYAIVGTGSRAGFFYAAIAQDFRDTATVVALCDTNQTRMNYANERLEALGHPRVPTYPAADFDRMVREANPDEVIVTTIDRTHDIYITRALALGRNVVTEKPMTIDEARCRAILDAVERAGPQRRLRVTFNYRYAPHNSRVRSLLASGAIGRVTAVHFEWALDTTHGADYFLHAPL
ncbi:hypothetical protein VTK73DRAFT_8460 [Phialemonium thermophilum]|uniref:Gfo/Idh/MocA-like oxidoreductase N-terminal domain-containing protein n=1 Tax=Phialemonium thermophilum TaxID=223376 RepID=A0ABR3W924_9PEZI